VRDLFEHVVVKERGRDGGSLGITRRTESALTTRKSEKPFAPTLIALEPGEACFGSATVEVTAHHVVDEATPETVRFFEPLFPQGLDLLVACLEKLIQDSPPLLSSPPPLSFLRKRSTFSGGATNAAGEPIEG